VCVAAVLVEVVDNLNESVQGEIKAGKIRARAKTFFV
jgi:hypothetical protein